MILSQSSSMDQRRGEPFSHVRETEGFLGKRAPSKIVFLVPSLGIGKSGVGDYTRLLSEEMSRTGHHCLLIALNDKWTEAERTETDSTVSTLRLPACLPWKDRFEKVERAIEDFDPEWISLQFVSYGFQNKGFVWPLLQRLPRVVRGRRLHILFHELWIGCSTGAPLRQRLVGFAQRLLVLKLVRDLQPRVLHTTNALYGGLLAKYGLVVRQLPLFGAIPISEDDRGERLMTSLRATGIEINVSNRHSYLIGGFFGTVHPDWQSQPLFEKLSTVASETSRALVIVSIGRSSPDVWASLVERHNQQADLVALGEQRSEDVSALLRALDFGIASTPWNIVGKSIGVATMLEHGLPVLATSPGTPVHVVEVTPIHEPQLLTRLEQVTPQMLTGRRLLPRSRLSAIARSFCNDLGCALVKD